MRNGTSLKLTLTIFGFLALALPAAADEFTDDREAEGFPGPSTFLRGAIQTGSVLQTNDFLKGDNLSGEPIDSFNSLRLEFGWQTDGSRNWHHSYNFPAYGIGLFGADYNNDEELGNPTSLYGFFVWPILRGSKWRLNFDMAFGFTNDWQSYDPVTNPKNTAMGLGRSVHIEPGINVEYRLAKRWALLGGFTATHFSNGGTQRPNHGLNQAGPILFVKYDTSAPNPLPERRHVHEYPRGWDLTVTGSGGKRNLDLVSSNPNFPELHLNRSYFMGNLTAGLGKRFSYKSRFAFGLDVGYDESVGDLIKLDAYNNGQNADPSAWDNFELALFGGYEIQAHRTVLIIHFAYKIFTKDVPNRLPEFYQRLGVRQFFYKEWFAGMNVRFHEIGSADNLEWTIGYQVGL